ncbi:MAG: hypothetical protein JSW26_13340 [Desulfobacterales bacterium]|nr:MAG: hypothetical protein JSW26_13340 [Desulfobacterales bacterium]
MRKILLFTGLSLIFTAFLSFEIFAQVEEDFDVDGDVDGIDLAIMNREFGRKDCGSLSHCAGDIHPFNYSDGDVDEDDLETFAEVFGRVDDGGIECLVLGDSIGAATHANDACDRTLGDHRELMDCLDLRLGSHDPDWSYLGGSQPWSIASRVCSGTVYNTSRDGDEWKDALDRGRNLIQAGQIGKVIINLGSNDVCAEYNHDYGSLSFVQPTTADNILSIEAEHFIQRFAGGTHRWEPDSSKSGASLTAVQARPDNGTRMGYPVYLTTGPRLDYRVTFARTGIHYVWIRGYATGSGDDSVHIGLDAQRQYDAENMVLRNHNEWSWTNVTDNGTYAFIDVATEGVHTLNVYMHEDGFRLDKIVLTTAADWFPSNDGPTEGTRGIFRQESSGGGLVSIETEHYHNLQTQGFHRWEPDYQVGYSGGAALRALPDNGTSYDATLGPRLDYNVNFIATGTYYVWIRGYAADKTGDTIHVGVDGISYADGERVKINTYNSWDWSNRTESDTVATIDILYPGLNTINIWMHEDGFRLDKIVLTKSSTFQPFGDGPDEQWDNDLGRIAGHIDDVLMLLSEKLPLSGKIYWSGVSDISKFRDLMVHRKHDHALKECQYLWNLDFSSDRLQGDAKNSLCIGELGYVCELLPDEILDQLLDIYLNEFQKTFDSDAPCGRMLDSRSTQAEREEARRFNKSLNDLMEQKAAQYQGRNGVDINFTQILWYSADLIRPYFISRLDCYHPNRLGQLKLAQIIWQGHHPDFSPTDTYYFEGFDSDDRCRQEFTTWDSCWYDGGDGQCGDEFVCSIDNSGWYKFGKESDDKEDHWLARDVGDLSDKTEVWAFFKHKRDHFDNDRQDWVSFMVWTGSAWQVIETFREKNDAGNHCGQYYNLTQFKNTVPFKILFHTNNSEDMKNGDKLMFDDVSVFAW